MEYGPDLKVGKRKDEEGKERRTTGNGGEAAKPANSGSVRIVVDLTFLSH